MDMDMDMDMDMGISVVRSTLQIFFLISNDKKKMKRMSVLAKIL